MAQNAAKPFEANCLPHGIALADYLKQLGATGLEVRACRVALQEGSETDEVISSDADESSVVFFGIYVRDSDGQLNCLHDMEDLEPGADLAAAQSDAVRYAEGLIACSAVTLSGAVPAPF